MTIYKFLVTLTTFGIGFCVAAILHMIMRLDWIPALLVVALWWICVIRTDQQNDEEDES